MNNATLNRHNNFTVYKDDRELIISSKDHSVSWKRYCKDAYSSLSVDEGNGFYINIELEEGYTSDTGKDMKRTTMLTLDRKALQALKDYLNNINLQDKE